MEFTPITTQEEFDRAIGERLKREKEAYRKEMDELKSKNTAYEKQLGELKSSHDDLIKKTADYDKTVAELNGKVSSYEIASLKARIAHEKGIPYELANRLTGDDEKTLREDAESLSKLIDKRTPAPPLKSTEPPAGDGKDSAYKTLLNGLKGE